LYDLSRAISVEFCGTTTAELRTDPADAEKWSRLLENAVLRAFATIRMEIHGDIERIALFCVLFRSQADQARRTDSMDASLGVFLTAVLVVGPFAFERSPLYLDRWIIGGGSILAAAIVGTALFFVGGREPRPGLGVKLALDLRSGIRGSYEAVAATINRAAADAFFVPDQAEEEDRGAAGDIAQLFMQDRASLQLKRRLMYLALALTVAVSIFAGYRGVIQSMAEDVHALAISGTPVPSSR
jgi:hypothetical protein